MSEGELTVVQSGEVTVDGVAFTKGVQLKNLEEAWRFCGLIARSQDMCPKHFQGKPEAILAAVQRGAEMGLAPMQSLQSIHIINGTTCTSGQVMLAQMNRPDVMEPGYRTRAGADVDEDGNWYGWVKSWRKGDSEPIQTTFTWAQAKAMGLTNRPNYKTQPDTMVMWRAVSKHARVYYSDVMLGLYLPEEMGAPMVPTQTSVSVEKPDEDVVTGASDPLVVEVVDEPDLLETPDGGPLEVHKGMAGLRPLEKVTPVEAEPIPDAVIPEDDVDEGMCPRCRKNKINPLFQDKCDACLQKQEDMEG